MGARANDYIGDGSTGAALKKALKSRGVSQARLSRITGLDESTVYRLCNGDRIGSLDTWMRISETLGMSIDELTGNGDESGED